MPRFIVSFQVAGSITTIIYAESIEEARQKIDEGLDDEENVNNVYSNLDSVEDINYHIHPSRFA